MLCFFYTLPRRLSASGNQQAEDGRSYFDTATARRSGVPPEVEGGILTPGRKAWTFLRLVSSSAIAVSNHFSAGQVARLYGRPEARRYRGSAEMRPLKTWSCQEHYESATVKFAAARCSHVRPTRKLDLCAA